MRDAESVVTALSEACRRGIPQRERVAWLLDHVGHTLQPGLDFAVLLMDSIGRWPSPRVVSCVSVGPSFAAKPAAPIEVVQQIVDQSAPLRELFLATAFARLRNPTTFIYSADTDAAWYHKVYRPLVMVPRGWTDVLTGVWASSDARLVTVHAYTRVGHGPFDDRQRDQLSLITRAVAPVMDSELFATTCPEPSSVATASTSPTAAMVDSVPAQLRRTLADLLHGFSVPEIAMMANKMTDEIEFELRDLRIHFGVASDGELIALFVDRQVLAQLDVYAPQEPGVDRRT
jgi:hypothetical protein